MGSCVGAGDGEKPSAAAAGKGGARSPPPQRHPHKTTVQHHPEPRSAFVARPPAERCIRMADMPEGKEREGAEALFRAVGAFEADAQAGVSGRQGDPEVAIALMRLPHVEAAVLDANDDPPLVHALLCSRYDSSIGHQALRLLAAPAVMREVGRNALMVAAARGCVEAARIFLDLGAGAGPDQDGCSALHHAAACDDDDSYSPWEHTAAGRQLLHHLATPECVSSAWRTPDDGLGRTALHIAAENGREEFVRLLLDQGADADARDDRKKTALHYAMRRGKVFSSADGVEVLRRLCTESTLASRDEDGDTPLHDAALFSRVSAVRMLLQRGADPNAVNDAGATPLALAQRVGAGRVVEIISAAMGKTPPAAAAAEPSDDAPSSDTSSSD